MQSILLPIAIILTGAKLGGELCERFLKQPAVLAEIVVGALLGRSLLGWISGSNLMLQQIAEVGAVLLLFEVGLETDITELFRVGWQASWLAVVGAVAPFVLGFGVARLTGHSTFTSVFMGAALTATSVGITARLFSDLGILHVRAARIVLGAAVVDDVLGLIILATISGIAVGGSISWGAVGRSSLLAVLFLVSAIFLGLRATPLLLKWARAMRTRAAISSAAVVVCLLTAVLSERAGLAPIVGAFAAGLVLSKTEEKIHFEDKVHSIADIFVPVFFVMMGARFTFSALTSTAAFAGLYLFVAAVLGKALAAYTIPERGLHRGLIAVGMVPRGEVGLIFASVGLSAGLIGNGDYAAILLVVVATTFIAPPWLKWMSGRAPERLWAPRTSP